MVFSRHLKYHGRSDVVFGKAHLRNAKLLQEFADHLPDFVSNHDKSVAFMEDLFGEDNLWTTLQGNLWNSLREDTPYPGQVAHFRGLLHGT